MKKLSRRDFLKTASLVSLAAMVPASARALFERAVGSRSQPNVIVIIFDTMSARNLSLYGYPRNTSPNFERFAERATVFHNHISSGNYTTPGTATILTGMYPWTHRAINQSGLILRSLSARNLFSLLGDQYNRFAFTQNLWADYLLNQFENDIDTYLLPGSFSVADKSFGKNFLNDLNAGNRAFDDFLFQEGSRPASLVFGALEKQYFMRQLAKTSDKGYSRGLPHDVTNPKYFRLEDVFDGVNSQLASLMPPFFSYLHLYAPHEPYRPRAEFENIFKDNWRPDPKPVSRFNDGSTNSNLLTRRTNYDEYVANVDAEFGRLIDSLTDSGVLANSIVVITSDHGQLFERGIHGHSTPLLFDPVIQVPLLISIPGQVARQDVYSPTNHVDLLPTLLHLAGQEIPAWCEGKVLPKLGGSNDPERAIYSVEAKSNSAFAPLSKVTVAMRRNNHKLIYYSGYGFEPWFELYDMEVDPEELTDLYPSAPSIASSLQDELMTSLEHANQSMEK
ncbi:MAG: sulfatase-like hydrolase/transferase [Anaerolineales bacterium]|nr:sulfatase-like hydrolase/transferase [Anaerolineales bacterium]